MCESELLYGELISTCLVNGGQICHNSAQPPITAARVHFDMFHFYFTVNYGLADSFFFLKNCFSNLFNF